MISNLCSSSVTYALLTIVDLNILETVTHVHAIAHCHPPAYTLSVCTGGGLSISQPRRRRPGAAAADQAAGGVPDRGAWRLAPGHTLQLQYHQLLAEPQGKIVKSLLILVLITKQS
jgi:hypothetical protein